LRKADNLTTILCRVMKSGNLYFLEPSGHLRACNGTDVPYLITASFLVVLFVFHREIPFYP